MVAPALVPRLLPFLLVLGSASACAMGDGMQNKLRDATSGYNRSVRWSDFDRAAAYLPAASQVAFLEHHDDVAEKLVIVDYDLTRLDLDKNTGIAASRAEIWWHTDRRLILETTSVDQLWQWHEGRFVLVDERRSGGSPLTIFAEVGEDPHPYLPGIESYRKTHAIGEDEKTRRRLRREARRRRKAGTPPAPVARPAPVTGSPVAVDVPAPRSGSMS